MSKKNMTEKDYQERWDKQFKELKKNIRETFPYMYDEDGNPVSEEESQENYQKYIENLLRERGLQ